MLNRLRNHDYIGAIQLARDYVAHHTRRDLRQLLAETPGDDRPALADLIRNVLSYGPVRYGLPVLLTHTDEHDEIAAPASQPPPEGWASYHWTPAKLYERSRLTARPKLQSMPTNKISAAVLVVETPDMLPPMDEHPTPFWWGELFLQATGRTVMSARMALPLPDAVEAAVEAWHAALELAPPAPPLFLSHQAQEFAREWGVEFRCRPTADAGAENSPNIDDLNEEI